MVAGEKESVQQHNRSNSCGKSREDTLAGSSPGEQQFAADRGCGALERRLFCMVNGKAR